MAAAKKAPAKTAAKKLPGVTAKKLLSKRDSALIMPKFI